MSITKNKIGLISGIGLTAFGMWLISIGLKVTEDIWGLVIILIYGGIVTCLGIYMLSHLNKEDQIEQIKRRGVKNE